MARLFFILECFRHIKSVNLYADLSVKKDGNPDEEAFPEPVHMIFFWPSAQSGGFFIAIYFLHTIYKKSYI